MKNIIKNMEEDMEKKARKKSQQHWTWIIIVSFFILGIVDTRFGILGIICMSVPIIHALRGEGKVHCSKYCPRGSFLGKFLDKVSFHRQLPPSLRTKKVKHTLLVIMVMMLSISMYHTGFVFEKVAFAFLRFMGASFVVGILMGVLFKPRSWCVVCPMGHASGLIAKQMK